MDINFLYDTSYTMFMHIHVDLYVYIDLLMWDYNTIEVAQIVEQARAQKLDLS